jgi:uncharacterized protein (TIGR02217 family)
MAFHETRLPVDIELGAVGGPTFFTTVLELFSGYEQRNINWSTSRGRWDIGYGVRKRSDMDAVRAFFYARRGKAHGFRFKDWTDYEISPAQQIGTGDGGTTQFQIYKRYSDGGHYYDRNITKPVAGTDTVYLDASETTAYTLDTTTGIITFDSAPANGVVVSVEVEFDVPVRFDIDALPVSAQGLQLESITGIQIVELRV